MRARRRRDPGEVVRKFGERMSRAVPLGELMLQLAEMLRSHLELTGAEVWLEAGAKFERTISVPRGPRAPLAVTSSERQVVAQPVVRANAWIERWMPSLLVDRTGEQLLLAPAAHGGHLFGFIVVVRATGGHTFTRREEQALLESAQQLGLALQNLHLDTELERSMVELRQHAEDLRHSRARVVAAADEERRRIERDLHDGTQQHLLALGMKLRRARGALSSDPVEAARLVDELEEDVRSTASSLRSLAQGIYPPQLRAGGLSEALLTATLPLTVAFDVRVARLPEEIEAAIYFCCMEALQNVLKHAGGVSAEVEIERSEAWVTFAVTDGGPGFDAGRLAGGGSGLTNMRDRVGALGGELMVDSVPGEGTRIVGRLPLAAESPLPAPVVEAESRQLGNRESR